jgi:hypothetical protein
MAHARLAGWFLRHASLDQLRAAREFFEITVREFDPASSGSASEIVRLVNDELALRGARV